MKICVVLCVFSLLSVGLCELYSDKYDNININEVIGNERLFNRYFACIMERGPCTADAAEFRKNLPEAIATDCAKCTEFQKQGGDVMLSHLINKKPDLWLEICAKYDPENVYRSKQEKKYKIAK